MEKLLQSAKPSDRVSRDLSAFKGSRSTIEAFINNDGGETRLALGLSMTLDAPTETPQHPILSPLPQRPKSRRPVLRLLVLALFVVPAVYWLVRDWAP